MPPPLKDITMTITPRQITMTDVQTSKTFDDVRASITPQVLDVINKSATLRAQMLDAMDNHIEN